MCKRMNERLSNDDHTLTLTEKKRMASLPAVRQYDSDYITVNDYYFCIFCF
jgi:hypothetical protein